MPHQWNLAEELEQVQMRGTKKVPGLAKLTYEDRLKQLKLPTLIYRRIQGDLINVYKYTSGLYITLNRASPHLNKIDELDVIAKNSLAPSLEQTVTSSA